MIWTYLKNVALVNGKSCSASETVKMNGLMEVPFGVRRNWFVLTWIIKMSFLLLKGEPTFFGLNALEIN